MPLRAIALCLALVLLWSGFSTGEHAAAYALIDAQQVQGLPAPVSGEGSVRDRHLDDVPAQPHAEHLTDAPGVPPRYAEALVPTLTMARPQGWRTAARKAPYLDGLQRPPCAASLTA